MVVGHYRIIILNRRGLGFLLVLLVPIVEVVRRWARRQLFGHVSVEHRFHELVGFLAQVAFIVAFLQNASNFTLELAVVSQQTTDAFLDVGKHCDITDRCTQSIVQTGQLLAQFLTNFFRFRAHPIILHPCPEPLAELVVKIPCQD